MTESSTFMHERMCYIVHMANATRPSEQIRHAVREALPAGSKILVDRTRTRRRAGRIFVVTTEEGLVVKRLERRGRQWFLASDHPSWEAVPWPREAEVVGEVRWASRTFE